MRADYDLSKSPPTHDFLNFLVRAELARREANQDTLEINIMPGVREWSDRDKAWTPQRRVRASRELLPQLAWLMPSVSNVMFAQPGNQTVSYEPLGYAPGVMLRAPDYARDMADEFLRDKPNPVSISLRQSSFQPARNASLEDWAQVAAWLSEAGYTPVIIPDIEAATRGGAGYAPAAFDVGLRLAIYEKCVTNLMTNFGPLLVALLGDVRVMAWKIVVPSIPASSFKQMVDSYCHPNANWGDGKHLFWHTDKARNIIREVSLRLPKIEAPKAANA